MKKYLSLLIAAIMMAGSICACSSANGGTAAANDKIHIVTTIFPVCDWVMNVLGENPADVEVTMLLDNGVDLHSYQPSAEDILKISTCDMFIYVGGESDEWVEDALRESVNQDMVVINMMEAAGGSVKAEEVVEGMQEEDHDHEHGHEEDADAEAHEHEEDEDADTEAHEHKENEDADTEAHEHGEEIEYDEHVWLSLRNAGILVKSISDAIQEMDPDHAEVYKANTAAYLEKLSNLDKKYTEAVQNASLNTLLFGDRFPFRYLTDDYGLDYYAAFAGCSAETEASFETITFLAGKADELGLSAILTIEGSDKKIAETIVNNTQSKDQKILTMDSMQSTTSKDVQNGTSYLSVMEGNLSVLTEALQ